MKFIILWTFLLLSVGLYAQSPIIDSLRMDLAQAKEDTTSIRLLVELALEQHLFSTKRARFLIQEAKRHTRAVTSLQEKNTALQLIGIAYYQLKQLDTAVIYFEQAERQVLQMTNPHLAAEAFYQMGLRFDKYGYLTPALQVFEQALAIYEELDQKDKQVILLEKLAKLYEEIKDFPQALNYLRQCLTIRKHLNDDLHLAGTLSKIGWNLEQQQSYEYALSYFFQAQAIYQQMGQEAKLPRIYLHLGSIHNHLDHLDSANFYLQKALNLARQIQDDVLQISSLAELGQLYEKLGDNTKARLTLEQAFRQADERSLVTAKVKQARTLYYLFKKLNRTQEALLYNEIYWAIRDSLVAAENARSLFRLEADYEFEKELQQFGHGEERQAKEKSEQLKRSRLIRLIISLILFLTVVILLIVYRYYQLKQDANKKLMRLSQRVVRQKNILQIQNKQLRELDQMKSHFFTNISHEFRTPLTVIDGMIQQIKKAPDKWMEKGLKMIERSNANLLRLINQILDLRKLESGKLNLQLEQGDVISYVKEIFESFEAVGKNKDVKLHLLSQQRALMMYYDAEKLLRLLSNLLSNAIKFTPAGGHVYLLIALNRNAEVLENLKDSAGLAIKVKDTGAGIPTEKLPFIFDRFYQVADWENQEKRGTGIGLALAKELVNVMKGSIKVSSELGKGTTFEVFLPLRYPDALG